MLRIPLTPTRHGDGATVAPYLEGILTFKGTVVDTAPFLVDTGADITLLNVMRPEQYTTIYPQGASHDPATKEPHGAQGVGGRWPGRMFDDSWQFKVLGERTETKAQEAFTLELPKVLVMSAFATNRGERLAGALSPLSFKESGQPKQVAGDRKKTFDERIKACFAAPPAPNLLGRDVIEKNGLHIDWAAHRQSWLGKE